MAGDKAVVAKEGELERVIILKAKDEALRNEYSSAESSKPSSTFTTPRASSVATPKGSVKGTSIGGRSTPAPRKYVSPMAKAREEKKRREADKSKDWPNLSDMETSSNPSSGSVNSEVSSNAKPANLPKFGEWDKHSVNSGPCYTLLFHNAAQEKKIGGPVRVHGNRPDSPPRTEDLYKAFPPAGVTGKKTKKTNSFLCCFTA